MDFGSLHYGEGCEPQDEEEKDEDDLEKEEDPETCDAKDAWRGKHLG